MISNLRSRSIQGFITDSAGNVIRNAQIYISRNDPSGSVVVDSATSDDDGYFVSNPLPNGVYDVLESGIITTRVIHSPDRVTIPCFKASKYNYYESSVPSFSDLVALSQLNKYKYFLQIEPEDMSIDLLGSSFPIYEKSLSGIHANEVELYHLSQFFEFTDDARITISRFDIEYYQPLTVSQSSYRRIKWAGVPGIRFKSDSKIVVPLDYFSIVPNNSFVISKEGDSFAVGEVEKSSGTATTIVLTGSASVSDYVSVYNRVGIGDILKVQFSAGDWYGIVIAKSIAGSSYNISLELWKSSRFTSIAIPTDGTDVEVIHAYHGIFQGMASLPSTVSEYFNVAENLNQQTVTTELYDYSQRYT